MARKNNVGRSKRIAAGLPPRIGGENRRKAIRLIKARDGGEFCHWCGFPLGNDITIEHLTPLSQGGTNELANLALVHRRCNR